MSQFVMSSSPHIRGSEDTQQIMFDVIVALAPAMVIGAYYFGFRAIMLVVVSIISCVLFETLYNKVMKKDNTVGDYSCIVTGMLLAYNLPVAATWWMAVIGSFFSIVIVKMLFGGMGKNFMNPALAGRAFLMSWTGIMTTWTPPFSRLPIFGDVDVISSATPLMQLKTGAMPTESLLDLFLGARGGCIGEVSVVALIAGGVYLLARKVINIRIPLCYIGTVALLTFIFPRAGQGLDAMLIEVMSGGLILGAFFMATDYSTSPVTPKGQIIFGVGCGLLTVFIRYFGGYPEGVSYSILLMNIAVGLIDKVTMPKKFGEVTPVK